MTGEKKYADKAYEYADAVCGVPDWVNGYHQFPVIHTRVWPWNVPDDQVNFSVDLEAVHTAMALAIVYDWLYPALDKSQRNRIRSAPSRKGHNPCPGELRVSLVGHRLPVQLVQCMQQRRWDARRSRF